MVRLRARYVISVAVTLAVFLYFGAYCAAYSNRRPAANMLYFVYTDSSSEDDKYTYWFFYPAYRAHRLVGLGSVGRHNLDRETTRPSTGP